MVVKSFSSTDYFPNRVVACVTMAIAMALFYQKTTKKEALQLLFIRRQNGFCVAFFFLFSFFSFSIVISFRFLFDAVVSEKIKTSFPSVKRVVIRRLFVSSRVLTHVSDTYISFETWCNVDNHLIMIPFVSISDLRPTFVIETTTPVLAFGG